MATFLDLRCSSFAALLYASGHQLAARRLNPARLTVQSSPKTRLQNFEDQKENIVWSPLLQQRKKTHLRLVLFCFYLLSSIQLIFSSHFFPEIAQSADLVHSGRGSSDVFLPDRFGQPASARRQPGSEAFEAPNPQSVRPRCSSSWSLCTSHCRVLTTGCSLTEKLVR